MDEVNATSQEYYCRLTDAGAALEAAAHASGRPVVLTHVAVGDGGGEVPAPAASATALVNEVYRRQIDGREPDKEDPNVAWFHILIPADEGGFWIREFGVYAAPLVEGGEPVLYAVGNHAPYYKQQAGQGQATTHELSIPVILSGTAEVEISVREAGYATELAFEALRATVEADRERLWENDGEGPKLLGGVLPMATQEAPGMVQPDGATATVDEDGLLSALGGNLQFNEELWLTESGTFTAPVTGWYEVLLIAGGQGGYIASNKTYMQGGDSGEYKSVLRRYEAGEEISFTIGAAGIGANAVAQGQGSTYGGNTVFDGIVAVGGGVASSFPCCVFRAQRFGHKPAGGGDRLCPGSGPGGASPNLDASSATYYGGGGQATHYSYGTDQGFVSDGAQGAIRFRFWNPARAAGEQGALLSARRMAPRATAAPATVALYDPETGQGSVWREEDAPAKLAEGLITREAWREICAQKAAEDHAAWLASPDSEAERFQLLRQARDARLAATDYLVAPDYPLTDDARAAVTAYRQALRDLPAEEGAPWDGGGELTPWPEPPARE